MKTVLLISSKVFHYRVSVYNYMWRRFQERGWDFKVAANALQKENQQPLKFQYFELPFSFSEYKKLVQELKPDVVMFHLHIKDRIFWWLIHWLKLRGTPVISWTKGANLDAPDSKLRYHIFNYFHSLSDALLLYSPREIKYIKPANRSKVFIANNTLNFEDFPQVTASREEIRKEFNLPFSKLVLFVGTMGVGGERKKVEHLIRVFNEIEREDIGLVLVGGGMTPALESKLNKKNSRYLGQVHDPKNIQISKLFKASDIFVVPGHVGLGINQAFFWGLPVITEEGLQPPEIQYLKDGVNGYIVPENDLAGLKKRILQLLDNDAEREQFRAKCREMILTDASIENMFNSFYSAVQHACGNQSSN